MNRLMHTLTVGLASGVLFLTNGLPAAAQPGGPCTFVNDDAITQALGTSVHAVEAFSIPDLQSCAVDLPDADPVTIMHITATEQSLLEGLGPIGSSEPVNVTTEPADGFAYSAMFVRIPIDGETLLSLRVQVADNDVYAFNTSDSAGATTRLSAIGHAVLQK